HVPRQILPVLEEVQLGAGRITFDVRRFEKEHPVGGHDRVVGGAHVTRGQAYGERALSTGRELTRRTIEALYPAMDCDVISGQSSVDGAASDPDRVFKRTFGGAEVVSASKVISPRSASSRRADK